MTLCGSPGNPDPPNNGKGSNGGWGGDVCPLCGRDIKRLPNHLPECPDR